MKVVLIHGQNHQGSSCNMGRILANQISSPEEKTEFFLPKDLNHFCTGCCHCLDDETTRPFYSDKKIILDAMEAAEVLIFTTPTYCMHASAPMKSFGCEYHAAGDLTSLDLQLDRCFTGKGRCQQTAAFPFRVVFKKL